MLQWAEIDTVLLDMDGTLLDLHYDNYFWLHHLPARWAEITGITAEDAQQQLKAEYAALTGKLEWYCLDYWQQRLQLPITELKREVMHKIRMRQDAPAFLDALNQSSRQVILLTNAHPGSLALKTECTDLNQYISHQISTHEFGTTKETQSLWQQLQQRVGFDKNRTLFVDDSLPILGAAKEFGIRHLLAVANPDSQQQARHITEFPAITDYQVLLQDISALR